MVESLYRGVTKEGVAQAPGILRCHMYPLPRQHPYSNLSASTYLYLNYLEVLP